MKKLRILLLGYSSNAQKSIIPALQDHPHVYLVGIASRSRWALIPHGTPAYNNYPYAIRKSECDAVYISLHNSAHYRWIMYALRLGKHVICDKPAVLTRSQAKACIRRANNTQYIFEAFPFLFHNQLQYVKALLQKQSSPLTAVSAHFGFTLKDTNNYRNFSRLGGGCIYDIGPNIIAVGNFLFDRAPLSISCFALVERGIPTSASVMLNYGKGHVLAATIGYTFEYRNQLECWGRTFHITLNRVFSIDKTMKNIIHTKVNDKEKTISIGPSDHFSAMFSHVARQIAQGNVHRVNRMFQTQATILEMLHLAARTHKTIPIPYA